MVLCAGIPANDYQYDENYSYEYDGEDTSYDDEIPKPNQKVRQRICKPKIRFRCFLVRIPTSE